MMEQYDILLVNLDPTVGYEIQKTRPCVLISPNEMNRKIGTVIIAPMITKSHEYPTRIKVRFQEREGWIVLDQIRTIDKTRIVKTLGKLDSKTIKQVKDLISEMLVE
jgi:mRNA interferase MazF